MGSLTPALSKGEGVVTQAAADKKTRVRRKGAKVMGLKQVKAMKDTPLDDLPEQILVRYGKLATRFIMIVYGDSFNGKTGFLYEFLKFLMVYYQVLYVALEEGFTSTTRSNIEEYLDAELHSGKMLLADADMTYEELIIYLKRKKSPHVIVIDSLQYWGINYNQYKAIKQMFPRKIFIFISHAKSGKPAGAVAQRVRFDADVKVFVMGFVSFIGSRFNKGRPAQAVVNWPEGAKGYWKKKYPSIEKGVIPKGIAP